MESKPFAGLTAAWIALGIAFSAAAQTQEIRINCGGSAYTASDGTAWRADQYYNGGDLLYSGDSISNTSDLPLYRSARAGLYDDFSYSIPVSNGSYSLSLMFAEIQYSSQGERVFNVLVNGAPVLAGFDILAETAPRTALVKTFPVTVSTGAIQISVQGVARRGILNAIRISPAGGTVTPPAPPPAAGSAVASINCGGDSYTAADGTNWSADQYYSGGDLLYSGSTIAGTNDLSLYRTARRGLYGNFSYAIPLANGPYVLKLKFAEIVFGGKGQRVFNVNVNGVPVLTNFDILSEVAPLAADDKTFPVTVTNGMLQIEVIGVTGFGLLNGIQVLTAGSSGTAPALAVSTNGMSFSGTAGGSNPAAQTAAVTTSAAWTASSNQSWLAVSPAAGTGTGSISVNANLAGLAAGTYSGAITVSAPGATGSPQTINVSLTVSAAAVPPGVSAAPSSLLFSATAGSANPAAQTVTISNSGGGTLNWTTSNTQPWLVLGSASGTGTAVVAVQAVTGNLAAGTYNDTITISAAGANPATKTVAVTFTVSQATQPPPAGTQPLISINCGGSAFTGADGTSWTADQYYTGGDLAYTGYSIAGTQDLALYRQARRGLYGDFSYTIPVANGSYTLKLKFAEIEFGGKGQRVFNVNVNGAPVLTNFDIAADAGTLTADDKTFPVAVANGAIQIDIIGAVGHGLLNAIQVLTANGVTPPPSPVLSVSAATMTFSATAGGPTAAAQTISISNSGGGTLSWTAAKTQAWLSISATSGTGAATISVQAATGSLAAGTYNDTVTISAPGATPASRTVAVTFTVGSAQPSITSFTATQTSIAAGQSTSLSWTASNAASVSIDQGVGAVSASGSTSVSPAATTTYTLTAANGAGSVTRSIVITVSAQTPPPAGNSGNTDQWVPNSNPPQAPTGGQVLYNGIQLPQAWPPMNGASQTYAQPFYIVNRPAVIPIDIGRQLFVDDFLIAQTNLTRVQHQPAMYPGNPVLAPGTQGQDTMNNAFPFSDGCWYDPADHLFKIWYFGGSQGNEMSYAYSTDGTNWVKPRIADAAVPNTNVVLTIWGGRDTTTVWMDLKDAPSRKFKAFVSYSNGPAGAYVLNVFFSPDGIHWTGPQSVQPMALSDRTTAFYNPFRGVWIDSARNPADFPNAPTRPGYHSKRERWYSESKDLQTWTPSTPANAYWTGTDERDPAYPGTATIPELYNLDGVAYESMMVGLFSWYYPDTPDLVELGVGFSRDGFNWVRPTRGGGPTNAFIPASALPNTWNGYNTQSAGGGFLVVGDQLYFYFSGRNFPHGLDAGSTRQTGLATLRRDGFYSMDAGTSEGSLTTRPVRFSGSDMFVNVADTAGQLQVEVLDAGGNVIPGFARGNSATISVDRTMQEVTWSSASIGSLAGQTVQFRFYLANGSLYSFWVSSGSTGASNGYVAAGGPGFSADTDTVGSSAGGTTPGTTAAPVISPAGGTFAGSVTVTMTSSTSGASIRYTTDGSDPTSASTLYGAPFTLSSTTTVKAKAFAPGQADSSIATAQFAVTADSVPPSRGFGSPSGTLASGTTQATLSLRTGEAATCRYATTAGTAFSAMTGSFTTADGLSHSANVTGLADGGIYNYYVRCQDNSGNANPDDFVINFAIASGAAFVPYYQYVEAEAGTVVAPMSVAIDPLASGGQYIATATASAGSVTIPVSVPATGSYYVWAKILSVDSNSDSFFVSADSGPTDIFDTAEGAWSTAWQWRGVNGRGPTGQVMALNPRIFTLAAGAHTLTFAGRDPNTKLDQVLVTNDGDFVPSR
jgi:hypothetical protein